MSLPQTNERPFEVGNAAGLQARLRRASQELDEARDRILDCEDEIRRLRADVERLERTLSWKITAPLRQVDLWLRRSVSVFGRLRQSAEPHHFVDAPPPRPPMPSPEVGAGKVSLRPSADPDASIVVLVDDDQDRVLSALRAIDHADPEVGYEVIVVATGDGVSLAGLNEHVDGLTIIDGVTPTAPEALVESISARARGRALVFVSASVLVARLGLESLVDTLGRPGVGMVCPKIIDDQGYLWDAGYVFWKDRGPDVMGRGRHPDESRYSYTRAIDGCSGLCFALRADLLSRLSWPSRDFESRLHFGLALSCQVRDLDLAVVYQPLAVATYQPPAGDSRLVEGHALDGDSLLDCVRARARALAPQRDASGEPPERACFPGGARLVVVFDVCVPKPDQDSGSLRMFRILQVLLDLGFHVVFLPADNQSGGRYGRGLRAMGVQVVHLPFDDIESWFHSNAADAYAVILSRVWIAAKFSPLVKVVAPGAKLLFDTVDLHFLRERRQAELEGSEVLARQAALTQEQELGYAEQSDVTLVVSGEERELINRLRPDLVVDVLSNIHEVAGSTPGWGSRRGIMFIGSFAHAPNIDGVLYFVESILPTVREALPDIELHIIGGSPPEEILALAGSGIHVTGYVPDVTPYLDGCRLSVAPLRFGAGVKGKVNQSMAHGLPVVATTIAAEGMWLTPGRDILIADDPQELARSVVSVYQDRELWERLSRHGKENIERYFSTAAAKATLERILCGS